MDCNFTDRDLLDQLDAADRWALDAMPFGVVVMSADGTVIAYNAEESRMSGLPGDAVIGRNFFTSVAPCTNNYLVAHRFETEPVLDEVINYVFTAYMKPTAVRLRMLKKPGKHMVLAVEVR